MNLTAIPALLKRIDSNTRGEVDSMLSRLPRGARLNPDSVEDLRGVSDEGKAYALFLTAWRTPHNKPFFDAAARTATNMGQLFALASGYDGFWLVDRSGEFELPIDAQRRSKLELKDANTLVVEFNHQRASEFGGWYPVWVCDLAAETLWPTNGRRSTGLPISMWDVPTSALKIVKAGLGTIGKLSKSVPLAELGPESEAARKLKWWTLINTILTERPTLEKRFREFLANPHGSLVGNTDMEQLSALAAKTVAR